MKINECKIVIKKNPGILLEITSEITGISYFITVLQPVTFVAKPIIFVILLT